MGAGAGDVPGKAAKFGANKANGVGANGSKVQPFWANFGANMNKQSRNLGDGINKWWTNMSAQSKNWKAPKWEMPGEAFALARAHE